MKKAIIATLLFATSFGVGGQVMAQMQQPTQIAKVWWADCSFHGPAGDCVKKEEGGGTADQCQACCTQNCSNSSSGDYQNCFTCCGAQQDNHPGNECSAVP